MDETIESPTERAVERKADAARRLNIGATTLDRWIERGLIEPAPAVVRPGSWVFTDSVDRCRATVPVEAESEAS